MDRVGEGFGQIREKRRKFLKAVYDLAHGHPTAHVNKADVVLRLGMDVGDRASDYRGSQKSSFVLCSAVPIARWAGYTGLPTSTHMNSHNGF